MSSAAALDLEQRMRLTFEVQDFLYFEASLLDERRYEEWLELLSEDIHYWMPIRRTTTAKEVANEFTQPGDMAFFDDDLATLTLRVQRLSVGRAWAGVWPRRIRRRARRRWEIRWRFWSRRVRSRCPCGGKSPLVRVTIS